MNSCDADERLRQALAAAPRGHGDDCPDPDRLWAGAHGALQRDDLVELVDHVSACGECAHAWAILAGNEGGATVEPRPGRRPWTLVASGVAALMIVAPGIATYVGFVDRETSEFRGSEEAAKHLH